MALKKDDGSVSHISIGGCRDEDVKGQSQAEILRFWMKLSSKISLSEERRHAYNTVYQSISTFEDQLAVAGFCSKIKQMIEMKFQL